MPAVKRQPKTEKPVLNLIEICCKDEIARELLEPKEETITAVQMQKSLLEDLVAHGVNGNVILIVDREYARLSNSPSFDLFVYHVPEGRPTTEDINLVIKRLNLLSRAEDIISAIQTGYASRSMKAENVVYIGPLKTETASVLGNSYRIKFRWMEYKPGEKTTLAERERVDITELLANPTGASKKPGKGEKGISSTNQAVLPSGVYNITYFANLIGMDEREAYQLAQEHKIGTNIGSIKDWTITEDELAKLFCYQVRRKTESGVELWTRDGNSRVLTEYQAASVLKVEVDQVRELLVRDGPLRKVRTLAKDGFSVNGTFLEDVIKYRDLPK
ncbi:hypothetical protein J4206_04495 [Candidatus Woesearchaeota archaeon]|nr:hypothetical protein [Candidatus Woesearchaeota archaeon]